MTKQGGLTLLFDIREDKMNELSSLLNEISADIENNNVVPYTKMTTIHLSRWVVIEATVDHKGRSVKPHLVFESNYDGPEEIHINQLLDNSLPGLIKIFRTCEGFTENQNVSRAEVLQFMKKHQFKNSGLFIGAWWRSVGQIKNEDKLWNYLQNELDTLDPNSKKLSGPEIHKALREKVLQHPELAELAEPYEVISKADNRKHYLPGILTLAVIILLLPLVLLYMGFMFVALRIQELFEKQPSDKLDIKKVSMLQSIETFPTQSQFSAVGFIKPSWLRRQWLRTSLFIISNAAKYIFNKGKLDTIPTIHFARWVFIDNGKRLLFISNVDGDSETYLTDFINKQAGPMGAVFAHTEDYPKTKWLLGRGARDYKRFMGWSRKKQIPSQVWYSAYKNLTVKDILHNTNIRVGLSKPQLEEKEAAGWLTLFNA